MYFLLIIVIIIILLIVRNYMETYFSGKIDKTIKGPLPLPIIGSMHVLGKYPTPFEGFTALSKIYGNIFSLYLGAQPCVVVNNFKLIKEVLIKKGSFFGGRPNYTRYHKLFGGDRNNSLALCDWSALQETRRRIARIYCSPKLTSYNYQLLVDISSEESKYLIDSIMETLNKNENGLIDIKTIILLSCCNMFSQYMCTKRYSYNYQSFKNIVANYDQIFWEINQAYAVDFMPWLYPFYKGHMEKLQIWANEIRQFILSNIVNEHLETIDYDNPPRDFTDALLMNLKEDDSLNWQHILFELEDFFGGHSAVGNLVVLTLIYLIKYPHAMKMVEDEIHNTTNSSRNVNLLDKPNMPYTEATIFETLRFTSSPIVPHVATQDTDIDGYRISKGTCVIMNNYELNKSPDYWEKPFEFLPERFIKNGKVIKPPHFIPFGTGKRTCIGQQLVGGFSFVIISTLVQHFKISLQKDKDINTCTTSACVALPPTPFPIKLTKRVLTTQ